MSDLIRREDVFKALWMRHTHEGMELDEKIDFQAAEEAVASVPAVGKRDTKRLGKWVELNGAYLTPGGTPCYVCGSCGGSAHLHGAEYPRKKMICDNCGRVNIYPWERAYEEGSSLWEMDGGLADG